MLAGSGASGLFDLRSVDRVLTTTKAVRRRLDLDRPVEREVIQECLQLAVHGPTANGRENWRWVVVEDSDLRRQIADYYRTGWKVHTSALAAASGRRSRGDHDRIARSRASADWLADHLHLVPVHVIACLIGRPPGEVGRGPGTDRVSYLKKDDAQLVANSLYFGSIYPAIWSFQLALRSRGLGSAITVAHTAYEAEIGQLLGIPRLATQVALLPVAYTRGVDFTPSPRVSARTVTYWDRWEHVG